MNLERLQWKIKRKLNFKSPKMYSLILFLKFAVVCWLYIIDEIDKVLAKHYGFTDEELDFIINYDIKYRMGDELNSEDWWLVISGIKNY